MGSLPQQNERMCIACRRMLPRVEMFRLVRRTGESAITINDTGHTCGKGFYLCRRQECLNKLQSDRKMKKLFSTKISPETIAELEKRLSESGIF